MLSPGKVFLRKAYHAANFKLTSTSSTAGKLFKLLDGHVDTNSEEFKSNVARYKESEAQYASLLAKATAGGGEKAILKHTQHYKKVLGWDRVYALLDPGTEFMELSPLVGLGMPYGDIPRAGGVSGIGTIHGIECLISSNDATVKGGTIFPISVKKQLRMQDISLQNQIPFIFIVDSGGAFLPLQSEIFPETGGRTFYNESILNSMNVPQLAIVSGSCTAGAAYIPCMVQEAIIVHQIGTIFLAGPPLVYAALGEKTSAEDLGGATMHCTVSGCTDHFAATEEEAFEMGRDSVATFNIQPAVSYSEYDEPVFDPEEIAGLIPSPKKQHTMNLYKVIARLVDGSRFHEFKIRYGTTIITGFSHIQGHLVGIVANNGDLGEQAVTKGSHFVQICSQRGIPIIFLQNTTSAVQVNSPVEEANLLRCQGRLMSAVACAKVPKLTVIVGNSFGPANYMMCGRSMDPNFLFVWPNARVAIMEPGLLKEQLLNELAEKELGEEEFSKQKSEIEKKVQLESSAIFATSRHWDDGMILPHETRKVLGRCLRIVKQGPVPTAETDKQQAFMRM